LEPNPSQQIEEWRKEFNFRSGAERLTLPDILPLKKAIVCAQPVRSKPESTPERLSKSPAVGFRDHRAETFLVVLFN